jgi:hypothetical protein
MFITYMGIILYADGTTLEIGSSEEENILEFGCLLWFI